MKQTAGHLNYDDLIAVLCLTQGAFAIHISEDAIVEFANDAMLKIWDKDRSVIGKSISEILPELEGQPFADMLKRVWNEGITLSGNEMPADIRVEGKLQTFYFNFEYRAIKNADGKTFCILHTATDVTSRVLGAERVQNLTRKLSDANEDLSFVNHALNKSNKELSDFQNDLQRLYEDLAESDARFRSMVRQAPVGICIIGSDLYIQEVNDSYLELVGKKRAELEKHTIWEAVPEASEAYAPILHNVFKTAVPFTAKEHEVILIRDGIPETVFIDFVYEPMKQDETVSAVMVVSIDVTDKVFNRRRIEEVEQRVRLAVEAAEMGTFDIDIVKRSIVMSERCHMIFGFEKTPKWEELISVIHPDYIEQRKLAHLQAESTGRLFYEAQILHQDSSLHWIRVQGDLYHKDGKAYRILGTVLDITKVKQLEQQKDDFISIASHELKTPITSLKASLQLLDRLKHDPSSAMLPKLIEQSSKSVKKISSLIDRLLKVSHNNETFLELNKTRFDLTEIINSCRNHIRVYGEYTLEVIGNERTEIYADEHAIDQVIVNLVNNAVKYASRSSAITLRIQELTNFVKISIEDQGEGISPDKIPHLFKRYFQGRTSGFNNSGLGLGLFIAADIIKRHGGQIGVESERGIGSTFWFTLPTI